MKQVQDKENQKIKELSDDDLATIAAAGETSEGGCENISNPNLDPNVAHDFRKAWDKAGKS